MTHKHRADTILDSAWLGCVVLSPHDERAHGNITRREECKCGAVRLTEINGGARVVGAWTDPSPVPVWGEEEHHRGPLGHNDAQLSII